MATSPENIERLNKVALKCLPAVLGALSSKNTTLNGTVEHILYCEASSVFLIDLIENDKKRAVRISGTVNFEDTDPQEIKNLDIYDGFNITDDQATRLENAFLEPMDPTE